jgi:CHAT domain-containing protein/tetratricopeptide (TPR) repeat protein
VALLRKDLAKSLAAIGDYRTSEGMYREALDVLNKRLDPNHEIVAQVLNELGMVLLRMDNIEEAASQFERAVDICRRVHGPGGVAEAAVLISYGNLFQETRDYAKAREYFAQATEIYRERMGETSPLFAGALFQMARALTGQHEYAQARLLLIEACRILESNRRRLRVCRCSMDPPYTRVTPYRLLAFNEIQMNNTSAAFDALERDYADSLVTRFDTRWFRRLNAAEARQERYVEETLVRLEHLVADRVPEADGPRTDTGRGSMREQLARAQQSWDILQERLRARYPADEGYVFERDEIQSNLQAGGALVGWMDIEESRFVYMLPPYGDVVWQELQPPGDDSLYTRFKTMLVDPRADDKELRRLAAEIYRLRLGPLEPHLQRMTTLYVVPSGPMTGIPVEFLPVDGRPIGAGRTVCYVPSASFFRWLRARPRSTVPASMLAIGDPPFNDEQARDIYLGGPSKGASLSDMEREDLFAAVLEGRPAAAEGLPRLAGTRREIESVADMFVPNTVLLGLDASEARIETMTRTLSGFGFVHLATYAIADDVRGERSSLVLSQSDVPDVLDTIVRGQRPVDGRLTLEEILRDWRLDAEVVTLSACQNIGARLGGGFGFAYVYLRTGARSVVFNRWRVPDTPTRILMKRFYHNLAERRLDKARALDDAKAWLRAFTTDTGEHPYAHPAYWASFALVGDPYWATH